MNLQIISSLPLKDMFIWLIIGLNSILINERSFLVQELAVLAVLIRFEFWYWSVTHVCRPRGKVTARTVVCPAYVKHYTLITISFFFLLCIENPISLIAVDLIAIPMKFFPSRSMKGIEFNGRVREMDLIQFDRKL